MSMLLGDKQRAPPLNNRNLGSSGPAVSSGLIWILWGGNKTSLREENQNRLQQVGYEFFFSPSSFVEHHETLVWVCAVLLGGTRVQEIQPTAA